MLFDAGLRAVHLSFYICIKTTKQFHFCLCFRIIYVLVTLSGFYAALFFIDFTDHIDLPLSVCP